MSSMRGLSRVPYYHDCLSRISMSPFLTFEDEGSLGGAIEDVSLELQRCSTSRH